MIEGSRPARPRVMGVVNVTPDSFSDGGLYASTDRAVAHGLEMLAQGADLLDVGGESTRPGAIRPAVEEELNRVVPVITALVAEGADVSVDKMRSEVAVAAIAAGATVVNDVSGGLADPSILDVVADSEARYVAMHWRAHSDRMADFTDYPDGVVETVRRELAARRDACVAAGIGRDRLVLDPGLGFAKLARHNWELLTSLDLLDNLGCPLLVGASRKSFLGALLADDNGEPRPVDEREFAHAALVALLAQQGVAVLRVHDVRATVDALRVAAAMSVRPPGATSWLAYREE